MSELVKDLSMQAQSEAVKSVSIFGGTSGLGESLSGLLYRAADEIERLRSAAGAVSRGPSHRDLRGARPDGTMANPSDLDHLRTVAALAAGTMPSGEVGNGGE